ncbi:hypothetical protein KXW19_002618, partial [Aspergillus fumigatus]
MEATADRSTDQLSVKTLKRWLRREELTSEVKAEVNVIHGRAANTTEVRIFAANHPIIE